MDIRFIGPYFSNRFLTESIWYNGEGYPIMTSQDITYFVNSRQGERYLTRKRVTTWLKHILTNERAKECVEKPKIINGESILYNVREVNFLGYNSIIDHLQLTVNKNKLGYIPARLRGKNQNTSRPRKCLVR